MKDINFYKCNKCGKLHFAPYNGDCNAPHRTYTVASLNKAYGKMGWKQIADPYNKAAK